MSRSAALAASWSDAQLEQELRAHTPDAVEELVKRFGSRTYRLALRITGKPEDAQEVTQDVMWTVARKIDSFKGESALGSWIYRITANAAYQKLRGRRDRETVSWEALLPAFDADGHFAEPLHDWSAAFEDPGLQAEARERLRQAIDSLPPDYRTAFVLHDMEGLPNPEIAELLGISLPAVKSRVHRSRLFLRQRLAEYFDRSA